MGISHLHYCSKQTLAVADNSIYSHLLSSEITYDTMSFTTRSGTQYGASSDVTENQTQREVEGRGIRSVRTLPRAIQSAATCTAERRMARAQEIRQARTARRQVTTDRRRTCFPVAPPISDKQSHNHGKSISKSNKRHAGCKKTSTLRGTETLSASRSNAKEDDGSGSPDVTHPKLPGRQPGIIFILQRTNSDGSTEHFYKIEVNGLDDEIPLESVPNTRHRVVSIVKAKEITKQKLDTWPYYINEGNRERWYYVCEEKIEAFLNIYQTILFETNAQFHS